MAKKITILSIDGGGIRGILPGVILTYIENKLQDKTGDKGARLSDYFDLMAGTSTGGMLTCLYITPGNDGRPKFKASEAVDLYLNNGEEIFSIPLCRRLTNIFGLFRAKYPVKNIERIMRSYLGDAKLSQALKPCLITAYEIFQRKTIFFNKVDTLHSETRDYYIRDIARSTSAAPTYFRPSEIYSTYGNPLYLADGGVFANNPAMCAYAEARTLKFSEVLNRLDKPDYPGATEMVLISVGTGSHGDPYPYTKAKRWGIAGWLKPLIDILMSGNSETVHYELNQLFKAVNPENVENYFRLEPTVGTAKSAMDLATKKNMKALKEAGLTYVADNTELLDRIVDILVENR